MSNELKRLQRAARAQAELLDQIYKYVDEQGLGKLGQSRVKALIGAHRECFAKGKQVFDDLRRVEAERDALAGYVERIASIKNVYGTPLSKGVPALGRILAETPTTSLARIKAQGKIEVLDKLHDLAPECHDCGWHEHAAELRRQAEGGEL